MKQLTDATWEFEKPTVVKFYADWCGPCKMFAPHFERVAAELGECYDFASARVEDNVDAVTKLGVKGIPAVVLIENDSVTFLNHKRLKSELDCTV